VPKLIVNLWWLWIITFGAPLLCLGLIRGVESLWSSLTANNERVMMSLAVSVITIGVSCACVSTATSYLAMMPVESLQIETPVPTPTVSPPPKGKSGLPTATKFEWDLTPGVYDAVNNFFIPLLKAFWPIWVPGWILVLLLAALNPEEEGRPKKKRKRRRI
jgi:hypothetical protein